MSQQSVLKWLCVGFMIGFVGVIGCQSIPIIDKRERSARTERFYGELVEAKQYRTKHSEIEAQPNYRSIIRDNVPELPQTK
jgi:hypothetical protein